MDYFQSFESASRCPVCGCSDFFTCGSKTICRDCLTAYDGNTESYHEDMMTVDEMASIEKMKAYSTGQD